MIIDPLFWLGLSILLVAVSLTAVLVAALPALLELGRAARSVEKLADTLRRELPPTLEAIRLTGLEISDLTDEMSEGVKSAGQVVKQVDRSLSGAKNQAKNVQVNTRGVVAGVKAAWRTWRNPAAGRRGVDRLPPSQRQSVEFRDRETTDAIASDFPTGERERELDTDNWENEMNNREASYPDINGDSPVSPRIYENLTPPEENP